MIKELRELGIGCHVGGLYMGVVVYAEDVLLMAPTRGAMQTMLDKCEEYAATNNIMFSTDPDPVKKRLSASLCVGTRRTWPALHLSHCVAWTYHWFQLLHTLAMS
jgi:hypothetical protein